MIIWLKQLLMQLLIWLLGFIDCVFGVFRAVAGLDTVTTPSGEQSISEYFMSLDGVQWAFWVVLIASVAICGVCTIAAIVKNVIGKNGESKSHVRTVGQALSTVFVTLLMATFLTVGVGVVDGLLSEVDNTINHDKDTVLSHEIIDISAGEGFLYDTDNVQGLNRKDDDGNIVYTSYLYSFPMPSRSNTTPDTKN